MDTLNLIHNIPNSTIVTAVMKLLISQSLIFRKKVEKQYIYLYVYHLPIKYTLE